MFIDAFCIHGYLFRLYIEMHYYITYYYYLCLLVYYCIKINYLNIKLFFTLCNIAFSSCASNITGFIIAHIVMNHNSNCKYACRSKTLQQLNTHHRRLIGFYLEMCRYNLDTFNTNAVCFLILNACNWIIIGSR